MSCGKPVPQPLQPTLLGLLDRHGAGLLALLLLVVMPVLTLALSPWLGQPTVRRSEHTSERRRWDPRSGRVGQPSAAHRTDR